MTNSSSLGKMRRLLARDRNSRPSGWEIRQGDCVDEMCRMVLESVDSIVCDPPAGIAFMGKGWDSDKGGRDKWIEWMSDVARECLRVLKPGGHALVWSLPRTSHWTATAWENAGFVPRDRLAHVHGSGFPKSLNISKAIDKAAGAEREVVGFDKGKFRKDNENCNAYAKHCGQTGNITAPATDEAKQWDGWGTALKPAVEDWWLFRKPLSEKTVAANVLKWGTGGINIDGCRVGTDGGTMKHDAPKHESKTAYGNGLNGGGGKGREIDAGRFPSNLIHDGSEEVLDLFPETKSGAKKAHHAINSTPGFSGGWHGKPKSAESSQGSAARFFYCAKASKKERNTGMPEGEKNNHPTVKPVALMRYLVRLVTPPGGVVLDPFCGSGTTLVAALEEGFRCVGIEQDEGYAKIARARLDAELKRGRT